MNKLNVLFNCLILMLLVSNIQAEITPKPMALDKRLLEVNFDENQVYKVNMQVGINSHLIFAKNEVFEKWYSGDNEAFVLTSHKNYVVFKPIVEHSKTNIFIITNKRHYNLAVQITKRSGFYGIRFKYPIQEREEKEKKRIAKKKAANVQRLLEKSLDPYQQTHKNQSYWAAGSDIIRPDKVFDNGTNTFFHFSEDREIPAIYRIVEDEVKGGQEKLTQFSVRDNWIVVPRVQRRWKLRLGKAVLCIENRHFLPSKTDRKSATASDSVTRKVLVGGDS